ncbi:MAG: hypothetical protein K1X74_17330 [Pirellulales bacterium]|nr:hypothetical protein [Pirellulales bacterium]
MMTAEPLVNSRLEAGNRLVAQRPWLGERGQRPVTLLQRTAALPGTTRVARVASATVLLADTYLCQEDNACALAERRLLRQLAGIQSEGPQPDAELVTMLLTEQQAVFEPVDGGWSIRSMRGEPVELAVRPIAGGMRVESLLVQVPAAADAVVVEALSEFLLEAQGHLQFARVELSPQGFLITGACATAQAEEHLGRAMAAVVRGVKRLVAEATALTDVELASKYLNFVAPSPADDGPRRSGA